MNKETKMSFNVLVRKEGELFCFYCLELDIVTAAKTMDEGMEELFSMVVNQIEFAFVNDNLENLYKPAPKEFWEDFYSNNSHRKAQLKIVRRPVSQYLKKTSGQHIGMPNIIETQTSCMDKACYVQ